MIAGYSVHGRVAICAVALIPLPAVGQTTQGSITGTTTCYDSAGSALRATVTFERRGLDSGKVFESRSMQATESGRYFFPALSPGLYRLRVDCVDHQPQEIDEIELPVAAAVEANFTLRRMDSLGIPASEWALPDTGAILHYYAADIAGLRLAAVQLKPSEVLNREPTISYAVDPGSMQNLSLSGRDSYTTLVMQPGVTADNATARGLGLSINGQRPSSSNFLLDGVEHNDYLLSGPLSVIAPEAIQEYRVSTNGFSAEFGGAGGFVANAVTRSGGADYHGLVYGYLNNDALNANSFQRNRDPDPDVADAPRQRKELYVGYWAGGPIQERRWFFSSAFERFRSRSRADPEEFLFPEPGAFQTFYPGSQASSLLEEFKPPGRSCAAGVDACPPAIVGATNGPTSSQLVFSKKLAAPISSDRRLFLERLDYVSSTSKHRLMARLAVSQVDRPDFFYNPYEEFSSRLDDDTVGVALSYIRSLGANLTNEIKVGWRNTDLNWDRPHPGIPFLLAQVAGADGRRVRLPGSDAAYEFRNRDRNWEISERLIARRGTHTITAGGGVLVRRRKLLLSAFRDGGYDFASIKQFGQDTPRAFLLSVSRTKLLPALDGGAPDYSQPEFGRDYSNNQFFGFVQDSFKPTSRLGVSMGLRYESFGNLSNTGARDAYVEPASGNSIEERLAGASLALTQRRSAYRADRNNWAARFGLSYSLSGNGWTVLRGSYGIFYDRSTWILWDLL